MVRLQTELGAARESLREVQEAARAAEADGARFKEQVRLRACCFSAWLALRMFI